MDHMLARLAANPTLKFLGPLAAWSLFVWVTRVRNIWTDTELSGAGQAWRIAVALVFSLGGLWLVTLILRRARTGLIGREPWGVAAFAAFTIAYWVIRDIQIMTADHSVGFIVVHLVLGVVSAIAAAWSLRVIRGRQSLAPVT